MVNLHTLEAQIQQAILHNAVESYKRQHAHWLNNRAIKGAILTDALLSWQSLVIIAATTLSLAVVVVIFHPFWIVAATLTVTVLTTGVVVETGWLWLSLADERRQTQALTRHLQPKTTLSIDHIHNDQLKVKLLKALQYWWLINQKFSALPRGPMRHQVEATHHDVTCWIQAIYTLATQADKLLLDTMVGQDLQNVPVAIRRYEENLLRENDLQIRQHLEQALVHRRQQLQTLQSLQNNLRQIHYKLDSTLSALGMVYSQLLLVTEGGQHRGQINRLQTDVTEEIHRLQDLIEAMDEIYQEKSA